MTDPALAFLGALHRAGVPLWSAPPGRNGKEFNRPAGWQHLTVETNGEIFRREPRDCVAGNMGGLVAVLDGDVRNGCDVAAVEQALDGAGVRVYGRVDTPGGGRHWYLAGHPDLPTIHATADRPAFIGYPGVEVISYGANVFLPGTSRPKYQGRGYEVVANDLEVLVEEGGDEESAENLVAWVRQHRAAKVEAFEPAVPWSGDPPDRRQRAYLEATVRNVAARIAAMGPDSGRNVAVYEGGLCLGNYVAGAGLEEASAVAALLDAARACGLVADDGEASVLASIRSGLRNGRARPRAVPEPTSLVAPATPRAAVPSSGSTAGIAEVIAAARAHQDIPDPAHLLVAMGVAATKALEDEPAWLLLVAPPSSGKTETTRALDSAADERLDDVSAAGLLSWKPGKGGKPAAATGVLARLGDGCRALVVFGDLSTLLASSDRGGRDVTFAILRRVYDGAVQRDLGNAPEALRWEGKVTVVGAVTGAIDHFAAHADSLGPRWLYFRIDERDSEGRRRASQAARRGGLARHRETLAQAVSQVVSDGARKVGDTQVSDGLAEQIEDAALVTCWGRAAVPRSGYGRREIVDVPVIEEPMRLVRQLHVLARGLLAIGLDEEDVAHLVRRVALDSMPAARRAVLAVLSQGELLSSAGVARAARIDRQVARLRLEELQAVHVVAAEREGAEPLEDEPDRRPAAWQLAGEEGDIIAAVFREHVRAVGRWCEKWVPTPHPPQVREEEEQTYGDGRHTSHHPPAQVTTDPSVCSTCGGPISEVRQIMGHPDCADCANCAEAAR